MSEDKKKVVGIMIPDECGKADKYELTAIMYYDESSVETEKEYNVFITKEDYEANKPFTSIKSNMNPTLLLFPDDDNRGIGCFTYDLVEAGLIDSQDGMNAIVVSEVVDQAYGKSFSNNYLEQKRINNHDASTYLYVKYDFHAIVSEEEWKEVEKIRKEKSRVVENRMYSNPYMGDTKMVVGKNPSKYIWGKLLRCS